MTFTKMRERGQLTIPAEVREAAHLDEGVIVAVEIVPEGVLLRPQALIDADQAWFWTKEWQEGEREASADIEEGRTTLYDSGEAFLKDLEARGK